MIGRNGQLARALGELDPDLVRLGRHELDLTDAVAAERAVQDRRPDLLINAAAYTNVDGAEDEPNTAFAVNRDGVAALARGAAAVGAALVHVSTDYVFDGRREGEWDETAPTNPINAYGASKLAGEQAALSTNPRTLILRASWLYAPWGKNFLTTMLRLADRERLTIVSDQHGKPTSVLPLARAIREIAPRLAEAPAGAPLWGVFHYAGRGVTSWAGFARAIFAEASGRLISHTPEVVPISSEGYPTRARRPMNSALDCTVFERTFGITTVDWHEALAEVISRLEAERSRT